MANKRYKDKYGIPRDEWDSAKEEMHSILIEVACAEDVIPYSELVQKVRTVKFEPHDQRFFHMLGEISTEEDTAGSGMLSVVVVHKSGDRRPGPGFFELAQSLGRDTSDIDKCWVEELEKVYSRWRAS